jgi:hypothetical protein
LLDGGRLLSLSVVKSLAMAWVVHAACGTSQHRIGHLMRYTATFVGACAVCALLAVGDNAVADERPTAKVNAQGQVVPTSSRYKSKRTKQVRGFVARGGYYSYTDSDVINVYGGSRAQFGSTNTYRDPSLDRQTISGPFDHDFFFDSGVGPGNNAPYPR